LFTDERHGIRMDASTKEYLHETAAMAYADGFAASNYTITGTGSSNADAQIDIGNGVCYDQDVKVEITHSNTPTANTWQQDLQGPARIPVVYHSGATGAWRVDAVRDYPFKNGTSLVTYNLNTAGTWSTPDATNTYYVAYWIVATNFLNTPIISVMGQRQDNKLSDAITNNTWGSLNLTNFPAEEFRPLYRVIVRTGSAYTNTPKAYFTDVADFRLSIVSPAGAISAVNAFTTVAVSGQSDIIADTATDTLTLVAGSGITLTTDAATDSVTIASSSSGTINSGASGAMAFYPSPGGTVIDDTLLTYSQAVGIQTITSTDALALVSNNTVDIDAAGAIDFTPGNNTNISLNTTGTGVVSIGGLKILNAAEIQNGGSGVIIDTGTVGITSATNTDIYITPNGTGKLNVIGDVNIGDTTAGVTVMSNWNNSSTFILLKNRNTSGVGQINIGNNDIEIAAGTGTHTGSIILKTGGSGRSVAVGDGTNQALITSAIPLVGTSDLRIAAGTGGAIVLGSATNSNITITPNGTGETIIGNLVATEIIVANGNTGAATLTPNAALGAVQSYTVTGNITLNAFGTPLAGQSITLIMTIGGSGSYVLTSTMKWAGGSKTISTAVGAIDIITVYYDGTTYFASLSKGFV